MRYSILVPMLVAMFGTEAVAQLPAYAASFVSLSAPSSITFQTPTPIVVIMQNTGTATWLKADGDVFLATQEPQDNYYWCIQDNRYGSHSGNRVLLPYDVAPGQQVTFSFVVKPLSCFFARTSPLRFRMLSQLHDIPFSSRSTGTLSARGRPMFYAPRRLAGGAPAASARPLSRQADRTAGPSAR